MARPAPVRRVVPLWGATLRRSIAGRDLIRDSGSSKQPHRFKPTRNSSSGHMGWTRSVAMLARTLRRYSYGATHTTGPAEAMCHKGRSRVFILP